MKKRTVLLIASVVMLVIAVPIAVFLFLQINPMADQSHLPGLHYVAYGTLIAAILYLLSIITAALGLKGSKSGNLKPCRIAGFIQLFAALALLLPLREYSVIYLTPILLVTFVYLIGARFIKPKKEPEAVE